MAPQDNFIEEDDDTWYVMHFSSNIMHHLVAASC